MPSFRTGATLFAGLLASFATPCCGGAPATAVIHGRLVDSSTGAGIGGAMVAIERDGHYVAIPNPSKASPAYQFGAITAADGSFDVVVPGGKIGVHTFAKGYFYGTQGFDVTKDPTSLEIQSTPLAATAARPTTSGARAEPSTVAPGGKFTLAMTAGGLPKDPLSDEIIAVEPTTSFAGELDPPSPGVPGKGYPDGEYKRMITAPSKPGTYAYHLAAITEGCVTSDPVVVTITVK